MVILKGFRLLKRDSCRTSGCRSHPFQALGRGEEGGLSETRRDRQGRSKIRRARPNLPAVATQLGARNPRTMDCAIHRASSTMGRKAVWRGRLLPHAVPDRSCLFQVIPEPDGQDRFTGLHLLSGRSRRRGTHLLRLSVLGKAPPGGYKKTRGFSLVTVCEKIVEDDGNWDCLSKFVRGILLEKKPNPLS
ncbi:hypothetical protein J6590_095222 [Homalodisca vitripennis]|nr:hypothetical protein J6590_092259 [Homalodisca vitripennis]KAG8324312.1 hypothetical protein J6590_095222 [Homalodisca vitripennis]